MARINRQIPFHQAGPRRRLQPNDKSNTRNPNEAHATFVRRLDHAKATGIQRTARVSLRAMECAAQPCGGARRPPVIPVHESPAGPAGQKNPVAKCPQPLNLMRHRRAECGRGNEAPSW